MQACLITITMPRTCKTHPQGSTFPNICTIGLAALRAKLEAASDAYRSGYRKAQEDSAEENCCPLHPKTILSDHCAACVDAQARVIAGLRNLVTGFPEIICLCGSTRFTEQMLVKQWELTKQGFIVVSWCALPDSYFKGPHVGDHEGVKEIVDEVHKRKIDLADRVFVLNVGGYIGESTRSEIEYAEAHGKPVDYLEALSPATEPPHAT